MEQQFRFYRRKGLSEMRPYIKGEDLTNVSVSKEDNPETDMGMIARNPKNHADQWYVAKKYFDDNLEEVSEQESTFEKDLESLINKYSVEKGSDTPDFIIAEFMSNCLIAYQQAVTKRDKWFGVDMWAADKISAQRKAEDQNL